MQSHHPTKLWHELEDGRIECEVCPRRCRLKEGQRGLCFVRMREHNQVILTTYGLSSGLAIDPVEKKPLYHFLPGSTVYSFGTAGCNLMCKFCQNWQISKARETQILAYKASPKQIAAEAEKNHCASVAYTYNEPTIFLEYAVDSAKECHKAGINAIAVTNGYICDGARKELYKYMDAANVDLKGFTDDFYKRIIGGRLQPVLDTLKYIKHETNVWLEITTLLIPDENDSPEEIDKSTKWIVDNLGPDVPMHFSAFHPAYQMLDKSSTPAATVRYAREIAMNNGVRYAYMGNVADIEGNSTYCHNCGKRIIERQNYMITDYQLTATGNCKFCDTLCAGVFAAKEE